MKIRERYSHCDGGRFTFKVRNDLKRAHKVFRVDPALDQVISVNHYGFPCQVGNAVVFCRPFAPHGKRICTHLTLDFNPSKTGASYGLYDDREPFDAIVTSSLATLKVLQVPFDPKANAAIHRGKATVSRMHLTLHFSTLSPTDVIEQVKQELLDRGIKFSSEGYGATVYVNKVDGVESRHWVLVFYDKHRELLANRPFGISDGEYERLLERARGVLRVELRLNSKVLKTLRLRRLQDWEGLDVDSLVLTYLNRLGLTSVGKPALNAEEREKLTLAEQRDYELWLRGGKLKDKMHPRTFQKRAARLRIFDVDIRGMHRPPNGERLSLCDVFAPVNLIPRAFWSAMT